MCRLGICELGLELGKAFFVAVVFAEVFMGLEGLQRCGVLEIFEFLVTSAEAVSVAFGFGWVELD